MNEQQIVVIGNLDGLENLQLPDPTLLSYYQDIQNRMFWVNGEIDSGLYELVQYIIRINREDKDLPIEKRQPIRIMFNSIGGELDVADTLVSTIALSKTPVYGYAMGLVASAASVIYLACHKRYALSTAYFVLHKGSANIGGDFNTVQAAMDDYKEQIARMVKYYVEKTTYPEDIINEKIKTDWYIHTPEALEYGVVNEVINDIDILY